MPPWGGDLCIVTSHYGFQQKQCLALNHSEKQTTCFYVQVSQKQGHIHKQRHIQTETHRSIRTAHEYRHVVHIGRCCQQQSSATCHWRSPLKAVRGMEEGWLKSKEVIVFTCSRCRHQKLTFTEALLDSCAKEQKDKRVDGQTRGLRDR